MPSLRHRLRYLRRPRLTRDGALFLIGMVGIIHETVFTKVDRPTLLFAFMAMVGLPAFLRSDERRRFEMQAPPPKVPVIIEEEDEPERFRQPAKRQPAKKVPAKRQPAKKVPAKRQPAKKVPAKRAVPRQQPRGRPHAEE